MPGSGTGTQAAAAQAVTAQTLVTRTLLALSDAGEGTWSEEEILSYLNEAIQEYSKHFPRLTTSEITADATERTYDLPYDTARVIGVEYPADEEPAQYLMRVPYKRPSFTNRNNYDVLLRKDLTQYPQLLLSFDPTEDEIIRVLLARPHDSSLTLTDNTTVPEDHHHILTQFAQFAAVRQLLHAEQINPTNQTSLIMSQLSSDMRRLELTYINSLNRILFHGQGESQVVSWSMDQWR